MCILFSLLESGWFSKDENVYVRVIFVFIQLESIRIRWVNKAVGNYKLLTVNSMQSFTSFSEVTLIIFGLTFLLFLFNQHPPKQVCSLDFKSAGYFIRNFYN